MKNYKFFISVILSVLYLVSNGQGTWTQKQYISGPGIKYAVGFAIGSKGYIGAGTDSAGYDHKEFWEYNPATDSWTQKTSIPGARSFAFAFSIGNKGYVGGGQLNGNGYNDLWEYDPIADSWTQKANFPGSNLVKAATFTIGNCGYVCTGEYANTFVLSKELWEYNSQIDSWSQKADFGGGLRTAAVGFSVGNKGYVGTGVDITASSSGKDFWSWDPATDLWTQVADIGGSPRAHGVAFAINNFGFVGTGSDTSVMGLSNDFWKYDPVSDTWIQVASCGVVGRWHSVAFAINCKGYVGIGNKPQLRDLWEYDEGFGPTASIGTDTTIIKGSSVELTATGAVTYLWSTGQTTSSINVSPTVDTEYCVTVTDANGCFDTACVKVFVQEIPCPGNTDLSVPNAFSPNNDGQNDVFCLKGWNVCMKDFLVHIYNRWGEEVFQSTNPDFCWDGTYKSKPMDAAVFVYYIEAELTTSEKIIRKGNISLIR